LRLAAEGVAVLAGRARRFASRSRIDPAVFVLPARMHDVLRFVKWAHRP